MKTISEKQFKDYRERSLKRISDLEERIIRLEKKEAESHSHIKIIPSLYLSAEDLSMKVHKILNEIEMSKIQQNKENSK